MCFFAENPNAPAPTALTDDWEEYVSQIFDACALRLLGYVPEETPETSLDAVSRILVRPILFSLQVC